MTWRIASWDPTFAQGTIESEVGHLRFDAAVALTDRFTIGEEVHVRLERQGESYRVLEISPVAWQAPRREPVSPQPSSMREIDRVLNDRHVRLRIENGDVLLQVDPGSYGSVARIELHGAAFVQMPLEGRFARVTQHERAAFTASAEVAAAWPPTTVAWVFRFEPEGFGEPVGYVMAQAIRLVSDG